MSWQPCKIMQAAKVPTAQFERSTADAPGSRHSLLALVRNFCLCRRSREIQIATKASWNIDMCRPERRLIPERRLGQGAPDRQCSKIACNKEPDALKWFLNFERAGPTEALMSRHWRRRTQASRPFQRRDRIQHLAPMAQCRSCAFWAAGFGMQGDFQC